MSIPITCSGCQATFDVPDNLAGKTIRCTSCKAQMTVSAEVPASADGAQTAAAKKPFGSGIRPAIPPAPKPAPTPAAKTSPAKPAAKPVAAKAVVADEEDDDEDDKKAKKTKPVAKVAAGAKKPGITGSTKKRRADDGDDDDDDDDTPRRKKKAQGGSGPMIAIIAVATVGLALVAAVGIYLASGSDDKSETASNTSGANTSTPGGTTPASGPGGPGRPGPGGPGQASSASLAPIEETPTPGAPGGSTPGIGAPTPAPIGSGTNSGGSAFAGFGRVTKLGSAGEWAQHTGDGFTADFPGSPFAAVIPGPAPLPIFGVIDPSYGIALVVSVPATTTPAPRQAGGNDQGRAIDNALTTIFTVSPELIGKPISDVTVDNRAAKEISLKERDREIKLRVTAAGTRAFAFVVGGSYKDGKPTVSAADMDRFFNSIKIRNDLVAGAPGTVSGGTEPPGGTGMPPGGIGQPPIGGIGQPPGGIGSPTSGSGDGNKKAKIENFYAGAFDTEKKEFYAVDEERGATRIKKGLLRRYSYPDFKVLGRYQLPQMASRAVIDTKAELLYAATVTNPAARDARGQSVNPDLNLIDNSSGSGDIAIYDLKQIREGKTADGKDVKDGAELKPVATISLKSMIHAIELSDDGKSLYALLTSTASGKKVSSLSVINTETRKDTRTALRAPVRDMAKAGDGKNLIIIEEFSGRTKATSVGTFDFASMSLINTSSFPGAVVDVAPIKSGGALVTVLPVNNQPAGGPAQPGGFGGPGAAGMPPGGFGPPGAIGMPPGGAAAPGAIGMPPGGFGPPSAAGMPPGSGAGGQPNHQHNFRLYLLNEKGSAEMDLGAGHRFSNAGYADFDAENKKLFVSSYRGTGLDVFAVTDASAANGLKLTSTIQSAGREPIGGHCLVSPDGKTLVFHTGVVIETNNVGGAPPSTVPPGGGIAPPGGIMPPAPGTGLPGGPGAIPGGPGTLPGGPGSVPGMPGAIPPGGGMGSPPAPTGSAPGGVGSPSNPVMPLPGGMSSPSSPVTPLPGGGGAASPSAPVAPLPGGMGSPSSPVTPLPGGAVPGRPGGPRLPTPDK